MDRIHFFEFEDQTWFPAVLRDAMTAYLRFAMAATGQDAILARALAPHLQDAERVIELGAGGGGVSPALTQFIDGTVVLTDLYPNRGALAALAKLPRLEVVVEPVDATAVPADLVGPRLMVNSFHHLPPPLARGVLEAAVRDRQPILIAELVAREPAFVLGMFFTPLFAALTVPFWEPFRPAHLVFAWLLPVLGPLVAFDGIVSCLRVYSPKELMGLTEGLDDFAWSIERPALGSPGMRATVLVGRPRA